MAILAFVDPSNDPHFVGRPWIDISPRMTEPYIPLSVLSYNGIKIDYRCLCAPCLVYVHSETEIRLYCGRTCIYCAVRLFPVFHALADFRSETTVRRVSRDARCLVVRCICAVTGFRRAVHEYARPFVRGRAVMYINVSLHDWVSGLSERSSCFCRTIHDLHLLLSFVCSRI